MALSGPRALIARSLLHYWRVNAAVAAGAAIAVAVLAGALLVGGSVRESLRRLALERLGRTEIVLAANTYFREELAEEMARQSPFCPLIRLEALAVHPESGRRAGGVAVYGVDSRFWRFHRSTPEAAPEGRTARLSPALAAELGAAEGDGVLLRFESHSDIPRESLHGRKENASRTVRLAAGKALPPEALGEFSLAPSQGAVRAAFVPLERLRRELEQPGKVNTALFAGAAATRLRDALRDRFTLADAGIRVRVLEPQRRLSLESASLILDDSLAAAGVKAAASLGLAVEPVFTYLANTIRVGERTVPYSLAAALPLEGLGLTGLPADAIVLNEWTARELNARPGATVTLEYFLWRPSGGLETKTAAFRLAAVVPIRGLAADRDLAPEYPGITEAENVSDWDPPFPLELSRIRPRDEDYWERYRTTPKAFLSVERGRELWGSRFGSVTSLRLAPPAGAPLEGARRRFEAGLRPLVDPLASGFTLVDVRAQAEEASRGATDFGEYFLYFSFFLVVSALLLAGLFFRLGVEQRLGEIGLLRSVGYPPALIRRLFLGEGVALAAVGCALGLPGAVLYGAFILHGLRTWWVDAVGTRLIELHISPSGLAAGAIGGLVVAAVVIALTLRGVARHSPRALLRGGALEAAAAAPRGLRPAAWTAGAAAMAAIGGSGLGWIPAAAGFFLGGTLLLAAFLCAVRWLLARPWGAADSLFRLGARGAAYRPNRSTLAIALIASATFLIAALSAFRQDGSGPGAGGYSLFAESLLPIYHDLSTPAGREDLPLAPDESAALDGARIAAFRLRPGDEASCLNLYRPRNPRILAPPRKWAAEGARFPFAASLAGTPEERANPWLLLDRSFPDGTVPAIADANSLAYVLHKKVGGDFAIEREGAPPIRLRFVAALAGSLFQSELLVSEQNFVRLFPREQGFRFFLIEAPRGKERDAAAALERALRDFGFDAASTADRLAAYHRVENTYLATFQTLGAFGLLLGTAGLAAVLLRNVLERRKELALLAAAGYRKRDLSALVLAENLLLVGAGLSGGTVAALVAIAPAVAARGGAVPAALLAGVVAGVFGVGLLASLAAVRVVRRGNLLAALRSE